MKIIYGCLSKSTLQIRKPMTIYRFMISQTVLQNLLPVFAWRQVIIGYLVKTKCAGSFLYIQIFQQFQLHVSVTLLSMIILLKNTCGKQMNVSLFVWVFKIFVMSFFGRKLWFTVLFVSNKQDKLRVIFLFPVIALLQSELVGQNIRIIQSSNILAE